MVSLSPASAHAPLLPPVTRNPQGNLRRVGVELEYAELSLLDSAALVAELFGGRIEERTRSHFVVDTPLGGFDIKLDMHWMQQLSREAAEERQRDAAESMKSFTEKMLGPVVSSWMPNEIVTPPIPLDRLGEVITLSDRLTASGAKGTAASPIYAFGLHLNPEMPDIPPARLRDYLAAFVVRQDWLKMQVQMDLTRQISTFAAPFPYPYAKILLAEDYRPDLATLIDDYLTFNPTRNRALDMLPLFMHFDEARVRARIDDERVKGRPAFHYRLPNCDLGRAGWSPVTEWNHWVEIERLAEDPARLAAEARAYLDMQKPIFEKWFEK